MKRNNHFLVLAFTVLTGPTLLGDAVNLHTTFLVSPLGNPTSEESYLETLYGIELTYLNKYDGDSASWENDGALGSSYFTVSVSGSTASISWDLTGSDFELRYILLKDGYVHHMGHLYTIWTVTNDQEVASGSPQVVYFGSTPPPDNLDRAISHISFFGVRHQQVPEPTTLTLLGLGLLASGPLLRRRV